jgi:hypothetical protein
VCRITAKPESESGTLGREATHRATAPAIEGIAEAIWDEVQRLSPAVTTPSPDLSPEGSGERRKLTVKPALQS